MANTDNFIDEVTEEMRRERLFGYVKRYGWIGILAVLLVVGGSAWNEWQKAQKRNSAEAFGDAVMAALDGADAPARQSALAAVPANSPEGTAMLRLLAAGEALAGPAGAARDAALADLKAMAGDGALAQEWRDLASLRWLMASGAGIAPAERSAGLQALAQAGRPFRPLAQEQLALERLAAGEDAAALADFRALAGDSAAPSALRRRAEQMIVVLGGASAGPAQD